MTWWRDLIAAGAVPAAFVPPDVRSPDAEASGAPIPTDLVEDAELQTHPVPDLGLEAVPRVVSFLDGIARWSVLAYDGYVPLVRAYVAAAARRRATRGALRTTHEKSRDFAVAPLDRMSAAHRALLTKACPDVEPVGGEHVGHPLLYLETVETAVRRARAHLEREIAEAALATLADDEWLVLDGLLSRSAAVAKHPRAMGLIRSHGMQFLEGRGLELALTLPAGHRTSVFRVQGGHTRSEVYSWYLRLWPWEGLDLLYGLLRIEVGPHRDVVSRASALSAWLMAERAPYSSPLYPLHHVEDYLKSRAPRDLQQLRRTRLPRTAS